MTTEAGIAGVEGPTDDPAVERLRNRQVKNFLDRDVALAGPADDLDGRRSAAHPAGNNNAYCQDNETSWFDWALIAKHADVHRFVTMLCAQRLLRDRAEGDRSLSLNQVLRDGQ